MLSISYGSLLLIFSAVVRNYERYDLFMSNSCNRSSDNNMIRTTGDAVWLSVQATTTEGFGDKYP
jgi:hypothetical protein